jgi:hypothetical protein
MKTRNFRAMTDRLAARYVASYTAKKGVESLLGSILNKNLGVSDAPEEFFTDAVAYLQGLGLKEGVDTTDLKADAIYPLATQAVMEMARKHKLIK